MPRRASLSLPGIPWHIIQRGKGSIGSVSIDPNIISIDTDLIDPLLISKPANEHPSDRRSRRHGWGCTREYSRQYYLRLNLNSASPINSSFWQGGVPFAIARGQP